MKAFISYSHKDSWALDRLHTHLSMLRRTGGIEEWYDREILAGGELDSEIVVQLEAADIFLLLVSPDFLASDYCYEKEMTRALERHDAGEAHVVPIIIEPCDWKCSPLHRLKALPSMASLSVSGQIKTTPFSTSSQNCAASSTRVNPNRLPQRRWSRRFAVKHPVIG